MRPRLLFRHYSKIAWGQFGTTVFASALGSVAFVACKYSDHYDNFVLKESCTLTTALIQVSV